MRILVAGAFLAMVFAAASLWLLPINPAPAQAAQASEAPPAPPLTTTQPTAPVLSSDEVDYVSRLPSPADLLQDKGAAEGAIVSKIVQTRTTVAVTYTYNNGRTRVVSYRLLPSVAAAETDGNADGPSPSAYAAGNPGGPVGYAPPPPIYAYNTTVYQQAVPSPSDASQVYSGGYQPAAPVYYDDTPTYADVYQPPLPVYGYYVSGYSYRSYPRFPAVAGRVGAGFRNVGRSEVPVGNRGGTPGRTPAPIRGGGRR